MLTDLEKLQSSEERVTCTSLSLTIETRCDERDELVEKEYSFSYAPEWDKWTFTEYVEKRTPDVTVGDRDWRMAQHILWDDAEAPTIDVPPEVSKQLADATGAESVTIQVPTNSVTAGSYEQFTYTCD